LSNAELRISQLQQEVAALRENRVDPEQYNIIKTQLETLERQM
jgi:hypothetical protein